MSVRKDLERDLYAFLDDMDPSGRNTKRMKEFSTVSPRSMGYHSTSMYTSPT